MAYCRPGEGSDVYVYRTGDVLTCHAEGKAFTTTDEQSMIDHLMLHRRRGQKVPERTLERLWHEARGLPYETDVEAALKEARGLT